MNGLAFIAGMIFGGLVGAFLTILFVGFILHINDNETDYLEEE